MLYYERYFKKKGFDLIIGVDEAGRGPLAGPVVAGAVLLKSTRFKNRIDDSKKLTALQREKAYPEIVAKSVFGLGIIGEDEIDRVNILVATGMAMEEAIRSLLKKLDPYKKNNIHVLVDGDVKLNLGLPYTNIIRGDQKSKSIACGSIMAKVTRDRMMVFYDTLYPEYGFLQHKGYPTKTHKAAIKKFGLSRIHRATFSSV
ncbi:MAG: ribonuclease HII [Candidatus Omnitrophica bacterium]|nr:ribonuclease HII [Candidatus Omnitrophota bacterium]